MGWRWGINFDPRFGKGEKSRNFRFVIAKNNICCASVDVKKQNDRILHFHDRVT